MQLVVCSHDILCRRFWKFVELQDRTQLKLDLGKMFPQISFKNINRLSIVPEVFWKCIKCPWGSRVETILEPNSLLSFGYI